MMFSVLVTSTVLKTIISAATDAVVALSDMEFTSPPSFNVSVEYINLLPTLATSCLMLSLFVLGIICYLKRALVISSDSSVSKPTPVDVTSEEKEQKEATTTVEDDATYISSDGDDDDDDTTVDARSELTQDDDDDVDHVVEEIFCSDFYDKPERDQPDVEMQCIWSLQLSCGSIYQHSYMHVVFNVLGQLFCVQYHVFENGHALTDGFDDAMDDLVNLFAELTIEDNREAPPPAAAEDREVPPPPPPAAAAATAAAEDREVPPPPPPPAVASAEGGEVPDTDPVVPGTAVPVEEAAVFPRNEVDQYIAARLAEERALFVAELARYEAEIARLTAENNHLQEQLETEAAAAAAVLEEQAVPEEGQDDEQPETEAAAAAVLDEQAVPEVGQDDEHLLEFERCKRLRDREDEEENHGHRSKRQRYAEPMDTDTTENHRVESGLPMQHYIVGHRVIQGFAFVAPVIDEVFDFSGV